MMSEPEITCERRGASGAVFLNRPQALNAITLNMVRELTRALDEWEQEPAIRNVVVTAAASKAFSAGGDIRLLYEQGGAGDHAAQLDFWREEYRLNRRIRLYPKPYVALVDGIVMGGGVGVSLHGSHRIAGDKFSFAMPEVGIGFFPDVGATYFLPRLPGTTGMYLALTGLRASASDAVHLGLASAYVPSARFDELANALSEGELTDAAVARLRSDIAPGPIVANRALIDRCFSGANPTEILARLDAEIFGFRRRGCKSHAGQGAAQSCDRLSPDDDWRGTVDRRSDANGVPYRLARLPRQRFLRGYTRDDSRQGFRAALVSFEHRERLVRGG